MSYTTISTGLRRDTPPMRLFEKAKRLGIWNPTDIDLRRDARDWQALADEERDMILRLTAMFQSGEEAVTLELLPLILAVAGEGRLEEEMYLTTFLFEEAKHTDFFQRFLHEVAGNPGDLSHYHTPSYKILFYEALPAAMRRLLHDTSPEAQVRASTTYNMLVEGVLAETGYHAYLTALTQRGLLPGTRQGIRLLKQDESRHIAYGVFLLSRLIAADDRLWQVLEETMNSLLGPTLGIIGEAFACYPEPPFGLVESEFAAYAMGQFGKRIDRIERARGATLEEIYRVTRDAIDADDG